MALKSGFTTGTCATIATRASIRMIFEQKILSSEEVLTPKGVIIKTDILESKFTKSNASCAIKKYSGDDPDITNGILIFVEVTLTDDKDIVVDGGVGVGRVTKAGLSQNIGEAAINKVPKSMILNNAKELFDYYGYDGGAKIIVSVPQGEEIAKKTFNPRLGIVGGISILGTSGIVEPMSEQAIIDTIKVEINIKKANEGDYIMIAPGNYGFEFIKNEFNVDLDKAVKCSNFIGEALDFANSAGFKGLLLIGHIGKFIKLAGGIMNTHSKNADCRMEILASNSALVCDDLEVIRKIMNCVVTDEAIQIMKDYGICDEVMKKIVEKAVFYVKSRLKSDIEIGFLTFSNVYGILGQSDNVSDMFEKIKTVGHCPTPN